VYWVWPLEAETASSSVLGLAFGAMPFKSAFIREAVKISCWLAWMWLWFGMFYEIPNTPIHPARSWWPAQCKFSSGFDRSCPDDILVPTCGKIFFFLLVSHSFIQMLYEETKE